MSLCGTGERTNERIHFIHFHPLSSTFIHFHLLSSTFVHFYPLLSTFFHFHSLSSTFIHVLPRSFTLSISSTFGNCNSIVYRNTKLWKIIIWLLCTINCFCLWYSIIWWYCTIFIWKKLWLSIIWFYDDFPSYDDYAS